MKKFEWISLVALLAIVVMLPVYAAGESQRMQMAQATLRQQT